MERRFLLQVQLFTGIVIACALPSAISPTDPTRCYVDVNINSWPEECKELSPYGKMDIYGYSPKVRDFEANYRFSFELTIPDELLLYRVELEIVGDCNCSCDCNQCKPLLNGINVTHHIIRDDSSNKLEEIPQGSSPGIRSCFQYIAYIPSRSQNMSSCCVSFPGYDLDSEIPTHQDNNTSITERSPAIFSRDLTWLFIGIVSVFFISTPLLFLYRRHICFHNRNNETELSPVSLPVPHHSNAMGEKRFLIMFASENESFKKSADALRNVLEGTLKCREVIIVTKKKYSAKICEEGWISWFHKILNECDQVIIIFSQDAVQSTQFEHSDPYSAINNYFFSNLHSIVDLRPSKYIYVCFEKFSEVFPECSLLFLLPTKLKEFLKYLDPNFCDDVLAEKYARQFARAVKEATADTVST